MFFVTYNFVMVFITVGSLVQAQRFDFGPFIGDEHFWLFNGELVFNVVALFLSFEAYKEFKAIEKENEVKVAKGRHTDTSVWCCRMRA